MSFGIQYEMGFREVAKVHNCSKRTDVPYLFANGLFTVSCRFNDAITGMIVEMWIQVCPVLTETRRKSSLDQKKSR